VRFKNFSGSYSVQNASTYSRAISSTGRVGTKLIKVVWLILAPPSRSRPSFSRRCHRAVLGNACNILNKAIGIEVFSINWTMRSPAPGFSPSKPMINPAITLRPALVMASTDSLKESRVFWNFLVRVRLSSSGVSMPKKTTLKLQSTIRSISSWS